VVPKALGVAGRCRGLLVGSLTFGQFDLGELSSDGIFNLVDLMALGRRPDGLPDKVIDVSMIILGRLALEPGGLVEEVVQPESMELLGFWAASLLAETSMRVRMIISGGICEKAYSSCLLVQLP
jgi:hypothetical protein